MKFFAKYAVAVLVAIGALGAAAAPADAHVTVGIGIGIGGPVYHGYNYYSPCSYYFRHDLPAPRRCYSYYHRTYPNIYVNGGFVFRDHAHYGHWRDRDDFRHWRNHHWDRHYHHHHHH
jgi:hypothetical protein